jgi:phage-related tail fiber protein
MEMPHLVYTNEYNEELAIGLRSSAETANNVVSISTRQRSGSANASSPYQAAESASIQLNALHESSIATGAAMSNAMTEEIKDKVAAAEARTDTKIARVEGKLDLVLSKLADIGTQIQTSDSHRREDYRSTRANIWGIGGALAILIVAIVGLFPIFFGIGAQVKDWIDHSVETHIQEMQAPKK